jgi:hypothetical protein
LPSQENAQPVYRRGRCAMKPHRAGYVKR